MIEKPKKRPKRHKMTVACDISPEVRKVVYERDSVDGCPVCIVCGNPRNLEVAHYISRAQGGMGIPENLVTLCKKCHMEYDGHGRNYQIIKPLIEAYLQSHYPFWCKAELTYNKHDYLDPRWTWGK